jgi:hypothetical protein
VNNKVVIAGSGVELTVTVLVGVYLGETVATRVAVEVGCSTIGVGFGVFVGKLSVPVVVCVWIGVPRLPVHPVMINVISNEDISNL